MWHGCFFFYFIFFGGKERMVMAKVNEAGNKTWFLCSGMWPLRHRIIQDVLEVLDPCVWLGVRPTILLESSLFLYHFSGQTFADLFLSFCVESVWADGVQQVVMYLCMYIYVRVCGDVRKSSRPQRRHKHTLSTGQIIKTLSAWDGTRG